MIYFEFSNIHVFRGLSFHQVGDCKETRDLLLSFLCVCTGHHRLFLWLIRSKKTLALRVGPAGQGSDCVRSPRGCPGRACPPRLCLPAGSLGSERAQHMPGGRGSEAEGRENKAGEASIWTAMLEAIRLPVTYERERKMQGCLNALAGKQPPARDADHKSSCAAADKLSLSTAGCRKQRNPLQGGNRRGAPHTACNLSQRHRVGFYGPRTGVFLCQKPVLWKVRMGEEGSRTAKTRMPWPSFSPLYLCPPLGPYPTARLHLPHTLQHRVGRCKCPLRSVGGYKIVF